MQENKKAERRLAKKSFKKAQEERKKEGPFSWVFLFFFSDFRELSQMLATLSLWRAYGPLAFGSGFGLVWGELQRVNLRVITFYTQND